MAKDKKKAIRAAFNEACLKRDKHQCVMCGAKNAKLDVHHITNREDIPNGGYVKENGITLCDPDCHMKAEDTYFGRDHYAGFESDELYTKIGSSKALAFTMSQRL